MINALGQPQTCSLLGGTSESRRPWRRVARRTCRTAVVLAARPGPRRDAADARMAALGLRVEVVDFDAERPTSTRVIARRRERATSTSRWSPSGCSATRSRRGRTTTPRWRSRRSTTRRGQRGRLPGRADAPPGPRHDRGAVVGRGGAGAPLELRLRLHQGRHGRLLPRAGRGAARHGAGVLVVRPGFVRTKMTEGRARRRCRSPPSRWPTRWSTRCARRELVWVPAPLRGVMSGLRHVPRPLFRRLPL